MPLIVINAKDIVNLMIKEQYVLKMFQAVMIMKVIIFVGSVKKALELLELIGQFAM